MKKCSAKKTSNTKAAKRTGPSRRTAAERAAIDKRAAIASRDAKRKARADWARAAAALNAGTSRKASKIERALQARCPSCHAQPGAPCFARDGRTVPTPHRLRMIAMPAKPRSIAAALAPLVAETAGNKPGAKKSAPAELHRSQGVPTIEISKIIIGKRHRKDFSHVPEIAGSINDRGGLISPISLRPDHSLIAGECRIRAWQLSKFAGQPIPFHVLDVDSIIAAEWDENSKRKDFTPAEAVAIKRDVEKEFKRLQAERARSEKAAPGRKASGAAGGRVADRAARFAGKDRRTIEKAEKVVDAAARDPKGYGDLLDEMNRTGKVNAAAKKLKVREAKAAIEKAPPALPMNLEECATVLIDFPWAGEMERDQAALDAAGRSFRPYPEMSIKTVCAFAREQIAPRLAEKVTVWLCVTNFILVRGYHLHVYAALGFKPENAATMLTWGKDRIGRGKILRDQTEHAIPLTRGNPLVDVFGENPPTTLLRAKRGDNSQKPRELYELVRRVTPAKRYAEIFSTGAHGLPGWDCHGDQVGKFAPAIARAAEADLVEEAKAAEVKIVGPNHTSTVGDPIFWALLVIESNPGNAGIPDDLLAQLAGEKLIKGRKPQLTKAGAARLVQLRALYQSDHAADAAPHDELGVLEQITQGFPVDYADQALIARLTEGKLITGKKSLRVTKAGIERMSELRERRGQVDLEEAIAAKAAAMAPLDQAAIDAFENADLYRVPADVIDAIGQIGGHTFARSIDWDQGEKGHSIATCQCGVTFRADRALPYSGENVIAPQEEAHWREVIAQVGKSPLFAAEQPAEPGAAEPAIAASAEGDDQLEIPPFLRRQADNKVPA